MTIEILFDSYPDISIDRLVEHILAGTKPLFVYDDRGWLVPDNHDRIWTHHWR